MRQATATGRAKHAITTKGTHVFSRISDAYSSKKRQLKPGNRKMVNDKTDDNSCKTDMALMIDRGQSTLKGTNPTITWKY